MSLFLVLSSHLFIARHLLTHVVCVYVLQLLLLHNRRRPDRCKVVAASLVVRQSTANVRRLQQTLR